MRGITPLLVLLALTFFSFTPMTAEASFDRFLSIGSVGPEVTELQQFLRTKGFFTYPETTDYFGPITADALARFQASVGLEAVGRVGPLTLQVLNGNAAPSADRTLSLGMQGPDVAALQQFLKEQGFFTYPEITSYFGPITEAALKAFQAAHGLAITGQSDVQTREEIKGETAPSSDTETESDKPADTDKSPVRHTGSSGSSNNSSSPAPTVSLTAPDDGDSVSGNSVTVSADATDAAGVEFRLDDVAIAAEDTSPPFSITWDSTAASAGSHTLSAVARNTDNVTTTDSITVTVDNLSPVISLVSVESFTDSTVTLTWETDEPATSQVEYGTTSSYGSETSVDDDLVTSHSVTVTGLSDDTEYHFRAISEDAAGNEGLSNDETATTYTSGAQALFDEMDVEPDETNKAYINEFYIDADSVLTKLDGIWMATHDSQSASLNWVDPNTYTLTAASGTVAFTAFRGWSTTGNGSYLRAGTLDASGVGTQYETTTGSVGVALQAGYTSGGSGNLILADSAGGDTLIAVNSTTQIKSRINITASQNSGTFNVANGVHMYVAVVPTEVGSTTSNTYRMYRNGVAADLKTNKTTSANNGFFQFFNGVNGVRTSMAFVGHGLSDSEMAILYAAANGYLSSIGAETLAVAPSSAYALAMSPESLDQNDTVTYTITANGTGTNNAGSFDIAQSGDIGNGDFNRTLAAAIAAAPAETGVSFDGTDTLTFTNAFDGTFSFTRTLTSSPAAGAVHRVRLSNPTTVSLIGPTATAIAGAPTLPADPLFVRGANVSGGEFGSVPGSYGTNYIYPSEAEIQYYADRGFTVLRLPFKWQRVQHNLYDALDENGSNGDIDRLNQVVGWITGHGMVALLDPHDYAGRSVSGTSYKIGTSGLPTAAFDDLWERLAEEYKDNDLVWFGLMNEPIGVSSANWKMIAQSAANSIRATGALNRILVPGTSYSQAATWVSSGTGAQMASFTDPAGNYAFEAHQYLDSDSSGTHGTCTTGAGASRIDIFTDWLDEAPGRKGFLGEFAAGDPAVSGQEQCGTELRALIDAMEGDDDFIGWSAWGGGIWWNAGYHFRLEPTNLADPDTNYMTILREYVP